MEACGAHNPKVRGSKPRSAKGSSLFFFCFLASFFGSDSFLMFPHRGRREVVFFAFLHIFSETTLNPLFFPTFGGLGRDFFFFPLPSQKQKKTNTTQYTHTNEKESEPQKCHRFHPQHCGSCSCMDSKADPKDTK